MLCLILKYSLLEKHCILYYFPLEGYDLHQICNSYGRTELKTLCKGFALHKT